MGQSFRLKYEYQYWSLCFFSFMAEYNYLVFFPVQLLSSMIHLTASACLYLLDLFNSFLESGKIWKQLNNVHDILRRGISINRFGYVSPQGLCWRFWNWKRKILRSPNGIRTMAQMGIQVISVMILYVGPMEYRPPR